MRRQLDVLALGTQRTYSMPVSTTQVRTMAASPEAPVSLPSQVVAVLSVAAGVVGLAYSRDGQPFVQCTMGSGFTGPLNGVAYGGGVWVVVGMDASNTNGEIQSSTDGVTWTRRVTSPAAGIVQAVAWSGGRFVASFWNIGTSTRTLQWSADGITWTTGTSWGAAAGGGRLAGATTGPLARFVWLDGTANARWSADGATWTVISPAPTMVYAERDLCWDPAAGYFIYCGASDSGTLKVMVSVDGANWGTATGSQDVSALNSFFGVAQLSAESWVTAYQVPGSSGQPSEAWLFQGRVGVNGIGPSRANALAIVPLASAGVGPLRRVGMYLYGLQATQVLVMGPFEASSL